MDIHIRVDRFRIFGKLILFGYGQVSSGILELTMTAEFISTAGALVVIAV